MGSTVSTNDADSKNISHDMLQYAVSENTRDQVKGFYFIRIQIFKYHNVRQKLAPFFGFCGDCMHSLCSTKLDTLRKL